MKIALLGATGAVGSHFLNKTLAAGYEVKALVRTPDRLNLLQYIHKTACAALKIVLMT